MMDYHVEMIPEPDAMMRIDSAEASRFLRPVLGPAAAAAMCEMAAGARRHAGQWTLSSDDLAKLIGVKEPAVAKILGRLEKFGIAEFGGSGEIGLSTYVNPPSSAVRDKEYPQELLAEFSRFVAEAHTELELVAQQRSLGGMSLA